MSSLHFALCIFLASATHAHGQGYRAGVWNSKWPVDMADLWRTSTVKDGGLPQNVTSEQISVDEIAIPFPAFSYNRGPDEVWVLGGLPFMLAHYVDSIERSTTPLGPLFSMLLPTEPHITKYNPQSGGTTRLALNKHKWDSGLPYIGGALMHANGKVYVVSQSHLYKIEPATVTIDNDVDLPTGGFATIYNGITTCSSGDLLVKYFAGGADSYFLRVNPDTLEVMSTTVAEGASPRLSVHMDANGDEYLYHLNKQFTFRFKIQPEASEGLVLDQDWTSRYDPYQTGEEIQDEPTSPVISHGRVHYTTNTLYSATTPMRIFWQDLERNYYLIYPALTGEQIIESSAEPGWSFFHLAIDDASGIIISMDQGARSVDALRIDEDGTLKRVWRKDFVASAKPAIASDRKHVYVNDLRDGVDHLVILHLETGEELARVATCASRATVSTITVNDNEVFYGSNEPGSGGIYHRFYVAGERQELQCPPKPSWLSVHWNFVLIGIVMLLSCCGCCGCCFVCFKTRCACGSSADDQVEMAEPLS